MGTNYYVEATAPCTCCGRPFPRLHIGKSSGGWAFLFAPASDLGIDSWAGWRAYLADKPIVDEYDDPVTLDALSALVENKKGAYTAMTAPDEVWGPYRREGHERMDADGYRFSDISPQNMYGSFGEVVI